MNDIDNNMIILQEPMESDEVICNVVAKVDTMKASKESLINKPISAAKSLKVTQSMADDAYIKLCYLVGDTPINEKNMILIITYSLQLANEMLNTSKVYKIELATMILRRLINENIENTNSRILLHNLIEVTIPNLINTIDGLPNVLKKYLCC